MFTFDYDNVIVFLGLASVAGVVFALSDVAASKFRSWRQVPPPPKWKVTFVNPEGIPIRTETLSSHGIARLIEDVNHGHYA